MTTIEIGRLLRAGTTGFVVGCRVSQLDGPSFGGLVRIPLENGYQVYGLIYDIHIDDDGLVRQLVTADGVDENILPTTGSTATCRWRSACWRWATGRDRRISHLLPPRPPLSLDVIYLCEPDELCAVHLRRAVRLLPPRPARRRPAGGRAAGGPLQQAHEAHVAAGDPDWAEPATQELITLLRDDYPSADERALGPGRRAFGIKYFICGWLEVTPFADNALLRRYGEISDKIHNGQTVLATWLAAG